TIPEIPARCEKIY
ncbi:Fructose-1,6-bisphosphatase class 1, partial [Haemophilus influenzae]